MPRSKKANKLKRGSFFTVQKNVMESVAWKSLSIGARYIYFEFLYRFNGFNHQDISMTYKEMKDIMRSEALRKNITQLIEKGFIDLVKQGGIQKQGCNIYGLSNRWKKYGTEDFETKTLRKWNYAGFKKGVELKGKIKKVSSAIWIKIRQNILKRDKYTCQGCGKEMDIKFPERWQLDIHHIIPKRTGGTDDENNLIALCRKCHYREEPIRRK